MFTAKNIFRIRRKILIVSFEKLIDLEEFGFEDDFEADFEELLDIYFESDISKAKLIFAKKDL